MLYSKFKGQLITNATINQYSDTLGFRIWNFYTSCLYKSFPGNYYGFLSTIRFSM